jgi:hypothetical protein
MALTSFAVCLLLGQISHGQAAPPDAAAAVAQPAAKRSIAAELLAEVLPPPEEQALAGRELTLVKALAGASDRRQRHEITRAYWRLSMAVAACHLAADQTVLLDRLVPASDVALRPIPPEDLKALEAARESAKALWTEAELQAVELQHVLADLLGWPLGEPLPLPADRPHIGTYQTKFELLFANRQPPVRTRMIDRTLPIRREAIETRAAAVQAARDALEVAFDGGQAGPVPVDRLLKSAAAIDRQRRLFLAAIEQYNLDIAEYVSAVAREGTTETEFVAMLIRPRAGNRESAIGGRESGIGNRVSGIGSPRSEAPASYEAPLEAQTPPDPLLRRTSPPALEGIESEVGSQKSEVGSQRSDVRGQRSAIDEPNSESEISNLRSQISDLKSQTPDSQPSTLIPQPSTIRNPQFPIPDTRHPIPHTRYRQPFADGYQYNPLMNQPPRPRNRVRPVASFAELQKLVPPQQQRQLAALLHWDQLPPEPDRTAIGIEAFLKTVPVTNRGAALAIYWHAREQAAWVQVLAQQSDRIEELAPQLIALREQPEAPVAMLRLEVARLAAKADLLDAQGGLFVSQAELMRWSPPGASKTWWWPETEPVAGGYPTEFTNVQQWERSSRLHRRLALRLPALEESLTKHAAAVIDADAARAIRAQAFAADPLTLDGLLTAWEAQTAHTGVFLSAVTHFNLAIGGYVLAVLPAQISNELLAVALLRGPAAAM